MQHIPALPTSVDELRAVSRLLLQAVRVFDGRYLYTGHPGHACDLGTAINVPTAILMAYTGASRPPASLTRSAALKAMDQHHAVDRDQLEAPEYAEFYEHHQVAQTIRFLAVCVEHDTGGLINEERDYVQHLAWWPTDAIVDPATYVRELPTYEAVIDTIRAAADHALGLARDLQAMTAPGDQQQLTTAA